MRAKRAGSSPAARLRRSSGPLAAGVTVIALLAALAWRSGGYFAEDHLDVGAIALAVLALLLVVAPPRRPLPRRALVALAALAALAAWTLASSAWSPVPHVALEDFQRDVVYLAIFALALLAANAGRHARLLVWAAFALVAALGAYALAGRLLPDLVATPEQPQIVGYRLAHPLGYWNALGATCAIGALLGAGLAADRATAIVPRALAAGGAVLLCLTGYLTISRGAWIALAAGLAVLIALHGRRVSLLFTLATIGGASALAVARVNAYPSLVDDPAGQLTAGHAFLPYALLCIAGAGVLQGFLAAGEPAGPAFRPVLRPVAVGATVVLVLAAAGLYAVRGADIEGRTQAQVIEADRFVDRQWQEFWTPGTYAEQGTDRLTSARGTRSALYRVAFAGFEDAPLKGEGAGAFEVRWMRERAVPEKVRDAHSLYLETLDELGLPGLLALLALLGAVVAGAVAAVRRPAGLGRGQAAAVAAAIVAWAVHAGLDWGWQMPAVTGIALVLAAALVGPAKPRRRRRRQAAVTGGWSAGARPRSLAAR